MARRSARGKARRHKSSKCPEPINTLLDIARDIAIAALTNKKIKNDYQNGKGADSAEAAAFVYGMSALTANGQQSESERFIAPSGLAAVDQTLRELEDLAELSDSTFSTRYCLVSISSTGETLACITEEKHWKVGDVVSVERFDGDIEDGIILKIKPFGGDFTEDSVVIEGHILD